MIHVGDFPVTRVTGKFQGSRRNGIWALTRVYTSTYTFVTLRVNTRVGQKVLSLTYVQKR